MSKFVHGQLVEMTNTFSSTPVICRYVKIEKDGYVMHKYNLNEGPQFVKHKYIEEIDRNNLLMIAGRSYEFRPGDEVICRVRRNLIGGYSDEIAVVAEVNNEWKYVVLTEPVNQHESSKVMYFEQILRKREYDRLVRL